MASKDANTHWHDGYSTKHNHTIYVKMMAAFNKIAPELAKNNITVYNANVQSSFEFHKKCRKILLKEQKRFLKYIKHFESGYQKGKK